MKKKEKVSRVRPDEAAAIELGHRISDLVVKIARQRGITQVALATELGYSRASFCQILHTNSLSRQWKLSTLCGVARVLGIELSDLFKAAASDDSGDSFVLMLSGTQPRSPERLALIIRQAIKGYPDADFVIFGENYDALFGCRIKDFELGAPEFYGAYISGNLGDPDALCILNSAVKYVHAHGGLGEFPLWAAVKQEWPS